MRRTACAPSRNEAIRFDLLKSTYRIDRDAQPALYEMADEVAKSLGMEVPVTLYQAQNPQGLNASLAYIPDEAHIVLHGPVRVSPDRAGVAGVASP